jgi:hypothetical protein
MNKKEQIQLQEKRYEDAKKGFEFALYRFQEAPDNIYLTKITELHYVIREAKKMDGALRALKALTKEES